MHIVFYPVCILFYFKSMVKFPKNKCGKCLELSLLKDNAQNVMAWQFISLKFISRYLSPVRAVNDKSPERH